MSTDFEREAVAVRAVFGDRALVEHVGSTGYPTGRETRAARFPNDRTAYSRGKGPFIIDASTHRLQSDFRFRP